ncbi:hypothetical protein CEXT_265941 [Caerostris extrusa]|uniref:Uncharacterized protein n=1 Tax=Caerostris extrusa TaxID=172846 RepID=A0AAV4X445_CAEEX|nr:hypothetical protein CEXT_265941 [Caerostris extrusa]
MNQMLEFPTLTNQLTPCHYKTMVGQGRLRDWKWFFFTIDYFFTAASDCIPHEEEEKKNLCIPSSTGRFCREQDGKGKVERLRNFYVENVGTKNTPPVLQSDVGFRGRDVLRFYYALSQFYGSFVFVFFFS